ncbi:MAG: hypothetical protein ACI8RD_003735 [Bacillariaceae sp.]|jgi:hypothetical protein
MGNNNNNNDDHEAAAAAVAARKRRRIKLISVLEGCDEFPFNKRNKTDELVENFLDELGDDIYELLTDNYIEADDEYRGLDSERDTGAEVEAAVKFFPEVLSRTKEANYVIL